MRAAADESTAARLDRIARLTFQYFDRGMHPLTGLVPDSTKPNAPATIAGSGHALACWVSSGHYAIDQGPVVLMIENHRSGLVWRLMQSCPHIVDGLRAAGFAGGWLTDATSSRDST